MRFNHGIDSCCHALSVFLAQEFDGKLSCTIEDIIERAKASESFPIPVQSTRLCDLSEELSTRSKILFLRNKEFPEKSWIVLDINTLLRKINGRIFAPQSLPEHCFTPTHTGVLPWSQIERHLPDLDPALVVSFLGRLEFCQVVKDPEVLSLIVGSNASSVDSGDEETDSPTSGYRHALGRQMSSSSSTVSSISTHTSGSSVLSERDGLPPDWLGNLFPKNTSPQHPTSNGHTTTRTFTQQQQQLQPAGVSTVQHAQFPTAPLSIPPISTSSLSSPPHSTPLRTEAPQSQIHPTSVHEPLSSHPHTGINNQHLVNSPNDSQTQLKNRTQNGIPAFLSNHAPPSSCTLQLQNASSPTIIMPPPIPTAQPSHPFSPPHRGSLLSPLGNSPALYSQTVETSSLPNHQSSPLSQRERQATSPPRLSSHLSKIHDQLHYCQAIKAAGSQPSLHDERTTPVLHRSPSENWTAGQQRHPHQNTGRPVRSQGGSPRVSRHNPQSPAQANDKFLFFPGLVNSGQPSGEMWLHDTSYVFYSGWCLQSIKPHKFFTPRFLQSLILRLAFGFAVSRPSNGGVTDSMSPFSRECTIWKNGLRWLNLDGVETFVEMVEDGRALLLLMRAKAGSELKGVSLRSALVQKILATKEEFCSSMPTAEYLIHPDHLRERESYPIITHKVDKLTRYDVNVIAKAIAPEEKKIPCKLVNDPFYVSRLSVYL